MNTVIRYAKLKDPPSTGPLVRLFRALILVGVWILVGLAALAVYARLA